MTAQEALKKLKGSTDDKRELFDYFVQKAITESLEEWEGGMLEAVKKGLFPEKKTVQMEATMKGTSSAGI